MAPIIQLGFDPQDDKLWYLDPWLWDDDSVENVQRPTERIVFRRLFRQARLLTKRGVFINLSPMHLEALRLEHVAMSTVPRPSNIYAWVSQRMRGISHLQVKAILDECSLVVLLRDAFDMTPLQLEWANDMSEKVKRAA